MAEEYGFVVKLTDTGGFSSVVRRLFSELVCDISGLPEKNLPYLRCCDSVRMMLFGLSRLRLYTLLQVISIGL